MKYLLMTLLLSGLLFSKAFAQPANKLVLNDLYIKWEIIENNHDNKPQSQSSLTFATQHGWQLPPQGWKLYFNFAEPVIPNTTTGGFNINHVNGDLFYLSPTKSFQGIKPNSQLKITFVCAAWLINKTDAPQGFYLIWDDKPDKFYLVNNVLAIPSISPKQYTRSPVDKVEVPTAQIIYEQNKNIRNIPEDSLIKIFPTPQSYHVSKSRFLLDANVKVVADTAFQREAYYLKNELKQLLTASPASGKSRYIIKLIKRSLLPEAYELSITSNSITIAASSGEGIFYGIQSLKTLIPTKAYQRPQSSVLLPGLEVKDAPRFHYRALMVDVARNFQPKNEIMKLLDLMALYKLNVLHFHLNDDEGWRIQIPALPELTTIGSVRRHTLDSKSNLPPSNGSGPYSTDPHGSGYYSKSDFIELLKYANLRHISIIPEIETPGHARAAIKSMDARYRACLKKGDTLKAEQYMLHDLNDTSRYSSVQYWNDNVMDVALPSTYNFIETVTDEVQKIYKEAEAPLKTIHFGGDEVPVGVWMGSPAVSAIMKSDTTIKSEDDLWPYYYKRVNQILTKHHLYLTAWEEVGTKKVIVGCQKQSVIDPHLADRNVHLEVWNNILGWGAEDLAYKLANHGYKVILSCVSNLYFDMAYNKAFNEPGYYWGGYADVDKSFSFIPYNYFKNTTTDRMGIPLEPAAIATKETLTETGKTNIVGLQGALWGETLKTTDKMEYMMLPKLLGLAERAWSTDPDWAIQPNALKSKALYTDAWSRFVNVLGKRELPRLNYYHNGFNYRIPNAGASIINGQVTANVQLLGFNIHYTVNGGLPSINSPLYTSPIKNKGTIRLRVFNRTGLAGGVTTIVNK